MTFAANLQKAFLSKSEMEGSVVFPESYGYGFESDKDQRKLSKVKMC